MISSGSGLLPGGAQRTADSMYASVSRKPSFLWREGGEIGKAGAVKRRHEKVAGAARAVTREHAPRPIGAVGGGCQADEQQPRLGIAKAGHR